MSEAAFVNDARVMAKGQVTIPKRFRTQLGLTPRTVLSFRVKGRSLVVEKKEPPVNPFEAAYGIVKSDMTTDEWVRAMRGC